MSRPHSRSTRPRRSDESDSSTVWGPGPDPDPSLTSSASEISSSSLEPLTPHLILEPSADLRDRPGTFAQAVSWKGGIPPRYPSDGFLAAIKMQTLHPGPEWEPRAKAQQTLINSLVVSWLSDKVRASGPDAWVNVGGDRTVSAWGPGPGPGPLPLPLENENENENENPDPIPIPERTDDGDGFAWRHSPLQLYLIKLRLQAGLLKEVKRVKRKEPGAEAQLVAGYGPSNADSLSDSDRAQLVQSSLSSGTLASPTPSLVTEHMSIETATDSAASSSAARHAGLNKPDFVIFGQAKPPQTRSSTTTTTESKSIQPTVLSAVGERKDDNTHAAEGLAQALGYGLTAHQVFGANFGFYWFQSSYLRFLIVEPDLIILESSAQARAVFTNPLPPPPPPRDDNAPLLHDVAISIRLSDLLDRLTDKVAVDMCANHIWDDQGNEDQEALQTLWNMWLHCVTLVLQQQTSCPRFTDPRVWTRIVDQIKAGSNRFEVGDLGERSWPSLAAAAYKANGPKLRRAAAQIQDQSAGGSRGGENGGDAGSGGHRHEDGGDGAGCAGGDGDGNGGGDGGGGGGGSGDGGGDDNDCGYRATMDAILGAKFGGREDYLTSRTFAIFHLFLGCCTGTSRIKLTLSARTKPRPSNYPRLNPDD